MKEVVRIKIAVQALPAMMLLVFETPLAIKTLATKK